MNLLLLSTILFVVLGIVLISLAVFKRDAYGWQTEFAIFGWFAVTVAVILGGVLGINAGQKHWTEANCPKWGQQMGYETKFVQYGDFTYDCLAKTPSGKWIPIDNVSQNDVVVTNNGDN